MALVLLAACTAAPARGTGTVAPTPSAASSPSGRPPHQDLRLSSGGADRSFHLYRPASSGRRAVPLVMVMHGYGGSGGGMEALTGFDREADSGGFMVAYPDGIANSWNAGFCCGEAQARHVGDVEFIRRLVDRVAATFPLDRRHVFAAGFSNGGFMAYRLACERPADFAAVASVAGTMPIEGDTGCHPGATSLLEIHGTADSVVPYAGDCRTSPCIPTIPDLGAWWARHDGCGASSNASEGAGVSSIRWTACTAGAAVAVYTVKDGTHAWFGAGPGGSPDAALDATHAIWSFFSSARSVSRPE